MKGFQEGETWKLGNMATLNKDCFLMPATWHRRLGLASATKWAVSTSHLFAYIQLSSPFGSLRALSFPWLA